MRNRVGTAISKSKLAVAAMVGLGSLTMAPAAQAAPEFFAGNGHFYDSIDCGFCTWVEALADAATQSHLGLQGYLVTITSAAENAFILSDIASEGWIAGTDSGDPVLDPTLVGAVGPAVEGFWRWAAGPENGQVFWIGGPGGSPPPGAFANWGGGEPNNAGGEDVAQFSNGADGTWNDLSGNDPSVGASGLGNYIIEFGGLEPAVVPEPATLALFGLGLAGLGWLRRRKTTSE